MTLKRWKQKLNTSKGHKTRLESDIIIKRGIISDGSRTLKEHRIATKALKRLEKELIETTARIKSLEGTLAKNITLPVDPSTVVV
ncbi:hypothetical protein FRC02_007303 [Tulasnella sp. 418]|nr:hypothetical protein FRC02_007303 [Tulasnella sp. 418]